MPRVKKPIFLLTAFSAFLAALILRCVQLFRLTDLQTGALIRGSEKSAAVFFALVAAFAVFTAAFAFVQGDIKAADKCKSRAVSVFSMLCSAAMFFDFVSQCLSCYDYASKSAYVALNKIIPMALAGAFALLSAIYFIVIGISFSSNRYDFRQLHIFCLFPFLWALCGALTDLTDYAGGILDTESVLKSLMLLFALLFFFFFAGNVLGGKSEMQLKALVFSGLVYGMLCTAACVPRFIAFVFRLGLAAAPYSGVSFMFSGAFAAAVSFYILFKKKD